MSEATSATLPPYCCVILPSPSFARKGVSGPVLFFVEARGLDATKAAGQLTCFGGKREEGEDPLECIQRECHEEMGWVPPGIRRAVDLYVDGALIAFFYVAPGPTLEQEKKLVFESSRGRKGVWSEAFATNMSPWHVCALSAFLQGEASCNFVSTSSSSRPHYLEGKVGEKRQGASTHSGSVTDIDEVADQDYSDLNRSKTGGVEAEAAGSTTIE
eukprot:INCI2693.3.p1 GENE.INCI2693.3~~INCI2693.3.p1  ORF type:complete len:215 (-),score=24.42 INCI2693.3:439-1083(-)